MQNLSFSQDHDDVELVHDFLDRAFQTNRFDFSVDPADSHISPAFDAYTISLKDVNAGNTLNAATCSGTRYYVLSSGKAVAHVDVMSLNGSRVISAIHPHAIAARGAMRALNIVTQKHQDGEYELRMLFANEVLFIGIWLHGMRDFIIPIEPTATSSVSLYQSYTPEALFELLKVAGQGQIGKI
jgi:hypothetical protein